MTDPKQIAAGLTDEACPATYGGEQSGHSFVLVTKSSYDLAPYRKCAKCGILQGENNEQ